MPILALIQRHAAENLQAFIRFHIIHCQCTKRRVRAMMGQYYHNGLPCPLPESFLRKKPAHKDYEFNRDPVAIPNSASVIPHPSPYLCHGGLPQGRGEAIRSLYYIDTAGCHFLSNYFRFF